MCSYLGTQHFLILRGQINTSIHSYIQPYIHTNIPWRTSCDLDKVDARMTYLIQLSALLSLDALGSDSFFDNSWRIEETIRLNENCHDSHYPLCSTSGFRIALHRPKSPVFKVVLCLCRKLHKTGKDMNSKCGFLVHSLQEVSLKPIVWIILLFGALTCIPWSNTPM